MSLQINVALTTRNGFAVASGAYCWLKEERCNEFKYQVVVELFFFKDKAAFDAKKQVFQPQELPDNMFNFKQEFTAANYAALNGMAVHNFVKAQLETVLGVGNVAIVQ